MIASQLDKCHAFEALHQRGPAFIIPNPWDIGTAKLLQGLGFEALATTSAGCAYALGYADGGLSMQAVLEFSGKLAAHTHIPVTVDFEMGFALKPEQVVANVLRLVETGVAGCSIEDYDTHNHKILDFSLAVERVAAVAEAVATLGMPFQFTARAENLFRGIDDEDDTIKRLQAFEAAGANVLFAPAIRSLPQLRRITSAVTRPVNVIGPFIKGATLANLQAHGATRISLGGGLNWHAVNATLRAGKEMLAQGTFGWAGDTANKQEVMALWHEGETRK